MKENIPSEYLEFLKVIEEPFAETTLDMDIEFEPYESIDDFNRDIEIDIYAKGFYAFASDGGNEAFAFDKQGKVYLLPLIGMSCNSAQLLAGSWQEFRQKMLVNA